MSNKLLIISPYPSRNHFYDNQFSALASYAKNTVESITARKNNLEILVLADKIPGGENWKNKNIRVKRIWSRNNVFTYVPLIVEVLKNRSYSKILIEMEWALFGRNPFILSLFPLYLLFLKILKKDITIVMHGIAVNFIELSPQLGLNNKSLKTGLFDIGIKFFYQTLISLSNRIIVLEKYFADLINSFYKTDKAIYIPHGVDFRKVTISKTEARKKLGIADKSFVILNFGFINWYKGSDAIVDLFHKFINKNKNSKFQLIMAGGISNIHKKDNFYRKFTEGILDKVAVTPQIQLTGFLKEKEIGLYFSACDLVILPYRLFISSSGPLSFALTYRKPFLISSNLSGYFKSPDFKKGLQKNKLVEKDIVFDFKEKDFRISLLRLIKKLNRVKSLSNYLYNQREWRNLAPNYISILNLK